MSKIQSITELCDLRMSSESYVAPKGPFQCKRCQRFGQTQRNCGYKSRCFRSGGSHFSGAYTTPFEQPQCCGCGRNTQRVTGTVSSRKKRRRPLEIELHRVSELAPTQATPLLLKPNRPVPLPNRRIWARAGTTSSEGACFQGHDNSKNQILNPLPSRSRRLSRSLK